MEAVGCWGCCGVDAKFIVIVGANYGLLVLSSLGDFFVSYAKIQELYGIGTLIVRFV